IDATGLWSGEPARDAHLKSADFLDVEHHPTITFRGKGVELISPDEGRIRGDLTIRGMTRPVTLDVRFLGQWETPRWEDGVDTGDEPGLAPLLGSTERISASTGTAFSTAAAWS